MEVLLIALAGSFLAQVIFSLAGIQAEQILEDTRYLFLFLVSEATITLALIALLLGAHGRGWAHIGWHRSGWQQELLIGISAVPVLFLATILVGIFFRFILPQYVSETNPLLQMVRTETDLALFLVSSVYVGGVKEEVQRAFALLRFERYLGGAGVGLVLWSTFFALGHHLQGVDNAVGAGVLGLLFGLLFLWRRSLVAPIVSHALYDIATLVIVWVGRQRGWVDF